MLVGILIRQFQAGGQPTYEAIVYLSDQAKRAITRQSDMAVNQLSQAMSMRNLIVLGIKLGVVGSCIQAYPRYSCTITRPNDPD